MNGKETVLSGIRATGNLHLGNYFGALSKFVRMQRDYDCLYFVADLHALTTNPDPEQLHRNVRSIVAEYLAAGLDPEESTLFVQSDVPEISEMYLLLNMHVGIGELMRTASFKDKARKQLGIKVDEADENIERQIIGSDSNKRVNAGLLTYPTLMAVDILIQKAHKVPVGKDQEQHLELTRRFARRFNSFYGVELFPEPTNFDFGGKPVKVPGLDGSGKMGKSEGNCIYLIDDEKTLRKKVMRAVTDEGPKTPDSRKPVHASRTDIDSRGSEILPRRLRRLLDTLRRPQEAACRRHTGHHTADTRAHTRPAERRRHDRSRAAPRCGNSTRTRIAHSGRSPRSDGHPPLLLTGHCPAQTPTQTPQALHRESTSRCRAFRIIQRRHAVYFSADKYLTHGTVINVFLLYLRCKAASRGARKRHDRPQCAYTY